MRDRFLGSIERETDRLIRMTNDLLTLTRTDAGGMQLELENLDLRKVIEDTTTKLYPEARRRKITIQLDLPKSPTLVTADRDRLDQVLTNIIDNALKHSPANGRILVTLRETHRQIQQTINAGRIEPEPIQDDALKPWLLPGPHVVIGVQDWGPGVPAEDLPHIFERFYRADYSRSRDYGGSGLGLAIARALVEAHGGIIEILSPSPDWDGAGNPGATAILAFPAEITPPKLRLTS